jgi:uncharacterized protein DUF4375
MPEQQWSDERGYWDLVEPVWLPLNELWDDQQAFVAQYRRVPAPVGHLYAGHWCQSEVCNGGFYQFFANTTGLVAPEAVEGFSSVGLQRTADVLQRAMICFGAEYPRSREERNRILSATPVIKDKLGELDNAFFDSLDSADSHNERWETAADAYAKRFVNAQYTP